MTAVLPWHRRKHLAELPQALDTLAAYAEIRGEATLAHALSSVAHQLASLPVEERARAVRALGAPEGPPEPAQPSAATVVERILHEGPAAVVDAESQRLPRDVRRLLALPGVALADVVDLHRRFGAVTAADLAAAATLAGLESSDREVLALHHRLVELLPSLREGHPRIPLGRAVSIAEDVADTLREARPDLPAPTPLGSVRRVEPTVGDIELLLETPTPEAALQAVREALAPADVTHAGRDVMTMALRDEQVTVRALTPEAAGVGQLYYTGSAAHLRQLQGRAAARGWRLTAAGLTDVTTGGPAEPACRTEADVYARLGLAYVAPELRHGDDEVERAARGALPDLVRVEDVRGDLHTHTLWSDARDSVETMVYAARALGYEFVAITDHSERTAASRTLTVERLVQQREDVERVRAKVTGITVLHGIEVEILPDGSLDFADEVLAGLDVVLASLHDAAGHDPDRLLERYLGAMRHPYVHIITHPTNRLVGRYDGYDLDFDSLFAAAAETGTALEVDGAPVHLDLDGQLAKRAVAAGVMLTIDSDCHNAARLGRQMRLGVGTARRGGVEARHVLNTRPLAEVLEFFRRKRRLA